MEVETPERPPVTGTYAKTTNLSPVFRLGPVHVKGHPQELILLDQVDLQTLLKRHAAADWGEFARSKSQRREAKLMSIFALAGLRIEVLTEWDCSSTTVRIAH